MSDFGISMNGEAEQAIRLALAGVHPYNPLTGIMLSDCVFTGRA
jgi:predicted oxidoreductase